MRKGYCRRVGPDKSREVHSENLKIAGAESYVDRQAIEAQAHELIAIARGSRVEAKKTESTYFDDARTLLFEALTASGHLSLIEVHGQDLIDINNQVLTVLLNGWNDALPVVEQERRFMEICEELTIQEIHWQILSGILPEDTVITTVSDFPDTLNTQVAQRIGYRAQNRKGMVRSIELKQNEDGSLTRVCEQVSRSNARADQTEQAMGEVGIAVLNTPTSKDVGVLGTQLISSRREMQEGVIGVIKWLDKSTGHTVRYGERAHSEQIPYHRLRDESLRREYVAEGYIKELASFTKALDTRLQANEISPAEYTERFNIEVRATLRAICTLDPRYAASCFGETAAQGFVRASDQLASGDVSGAIATIQSNAEYEADPVACGSSIAAHKQNNANDASLLAKKLELGIQNWPWVDGTCRITECPTRKTTRKVKVGPCSVCHMCQKHFDKGNNPRSEYRRAEREARVKEKIANFHARRKYESQQKERHHTHRAAQKIGRHTIKREMIEV